MPQAKTPSKEEAAKMFVEVALDDAFNIAEEYTALVSRRKANREQLRSLASQGHLTDEQNELLAELYPARKLKDQEAEENAAENAGEPAGEPVNA